MADREQGRLFHPIHKLAAKEYGKAVCVFRKDEVQRACGGA